MTIFSRLCFCCFQSLPAPVKRRLKALKKIQLESTKIEAKFYEEVHKLECKYHELYKPLYEQRVKITKGKKDDSFIRCDLHVSFTKNWLQYVQHSFRIFSSR